MRIETSGNVGMSRERLRRAKNAASLHSEKQAEVGFLVPFIRRFLGPSTVAIPVLSFIYLLSVGAAAQAESTTPSAARLPTLTTARQAHGLSGEEAKRAYPVHLRAVVTYFDTNSGSGRGAIYVHDSTGSIFVKTPGGSVKSLPIGSMVDLRGVSDLGGFAPVVDRAQIKIIGHQTLLPDAVPVSRTQLFAGEFEGQWVEVEGIVRSVSGSSHTAVLELEMMDGTLFATSVREEGGAYSGLVDAKVRIRGNEAPLYNGSGLRIGSRLLFPNLSAVQVVEAAPGDPFQLPTVLIDSLFRWDHISSMRHRVHLRGRVTMQWPGASLCIRDASGGICAQTVQDTRLAVGDVADVAGFAGAENSTAALTNALFKRVESGVPVAAEPLTPEQALLGKHNSELVEVQGQLIGRDLASSDTTLMLTSGKFIFNAVLPKGIAGPETVAWRNGSILRIAGICSVQFDPQLSVLKDGVAVPSSFRILMRSPQDVVVVHKPPLWTPHHALVLLALLLTCTLVVLGWVMVLRKRLVQQAVLLRESEGRFRHMALHDALTGLATRVLLQDRLSAAVETANRHRTGMAVLMVDIDRFKGINDTFGHKAGDEVLRVTADRLVEAVRKTDTVARLGGDEFVVLLADLRDPQIAERIAANIVETMAAPVLFEELEVPVSASVGVCSALTGELDTDLLVRNADAALYQAKASGRNRFQVFTPEVTGKEVG